MVSWYIKNIYIIKYYNFEIKLNYDFKTWKNQASVWLAITTTPHHFQLSYFLILNGTICSLIGNHNK
jgi:hypothetical protein